MYQYIVNPENNKKINISSKSGKDIIKKYIKILIGGSSNEKRTVKSKNIYIYLHENKHKFRIKKDISIYELKRKIQNKLKIPISEQILIINDSIIQRTDSFDNLTEEQQELFDIPSSPFIYKNEDILLYDNIINNLEFILNIKCTPKSTCELSKLQLYDIDGNIIIKSYIYHASIILECSETNHSNSSNKKYIEIQVYGDAAIKIRENNNISKGMHKILECDLNGSKFISTSKTVNRKTNFRIDTSKSGGIYRNRCKRLLETLKKNGVKI